jgi:hypothetical protein
MYIHTYVTVHTGEIVMIGGTRFERRGRALVNMDVSDEELRRIDRAKRSAGLAASRGP